MSPKETNSKIAVAYRKTENLHIVFWLLKDIGWCMVWKPLGIAMVIPTLIISIVISWRTRAEKSELFHNLAITAWIIANSYWMVSEFFHFEEMKIWGNFTYKQLALIPFVTGVLLLAYYYLYWQIAHKKTIE